MTLEADMISLKTKFVLKFRYKIDFNNSFNGLLGFDNILIENIKESSKVVENTLVKNVSTECNLVVHI